MTQKNNIQQDDTKDAISSIHFIIFICFCFLIAITKSLFLTTCITLIIYFGLKFLYDAYKDSSLSQPIIHSDIPCKTDQDANTLKQKEIQNIQNKFDRLQNRYNEIKNTTIKLFIWCVLSFLSFLVIMGIFKAKFLAIIILLVFSTLYTSLFLIYTLLLKLRIFLYKAIHLDTLTVELTEDQLNPHPPEDVNISISNQDLDTVKISNSIPVNDNTTSQLSYGWQPVEYFTRLEWHHLPNVSGQNLPTAKDFYDFLILYQKHVSPQLILRHQKQIVEITTIFKNIQLNMQNNRLLSVQKNWRDIQQNSLDNIQQCVQHYLNYPEHQRYTFHRDLQQVPDLWLSKQLQVIIDDLLDATKHLRDTEQDKIAEKTPKYPVELNNSFSEPQTLVFQFNQYQKQVSPQLILRYRKQLNEIYQIFVSTNLNIQQQPLAIRQNMEETQQLYFDKVQQTIQQYLGYPEYQRFIYHPELQQVPDLWLSQQLNKIIDDLIDSTEHLYLKDIQSLLDHKQFLKQNLTPEQPFKVGKDLDQN